MGDIKIVAKNSHEIFLQGHISCQSPKRVNIWYVYILEFSEGPKIEENNAKNNLLHNEAKGNLH